MSFSGRASIFKMAARHMTDYTRPFDDAYGGDAVELSTPLGLGGMHTAAWEPRLPVASHRRNLTHAASQPIVNI